MIEKLYLNQFRNFSNEELHFHPGINWVVGRNGMGKTNILEAISLLSTGRSFRTTQLNQLIQHDAAHFFVETTLPNDTLSISFDGQVKKVTHNKTSYTTFTPMLGLLPVVLLAPEDLSLISGMPAQRRRFLNLFLALVDPLYVHHLTRYHRAMRQRNTLLRDKSLDPLNAFESAMAQSGLFLIEKRRAVMEKLQQPFSEMTHHLSGKSEEVEVVYRPSIDATTEDELKEQWEKNRSKELLLGTTLVGPHRDDLAFTLGGQEARHVASQGQRQGMVSALRLAEWHFLKNRGAAPLLCVDDFGSHLDAERQERFCESIQSLGQVILTAPQESPLQVLEKSST